MFVLHFLPLNIDNLIHARQEACFPSSAKCPVSELLYSVTSGLVSNDCKARTRSKDSGQSSQPSAPSRLNVSDAASEPRPGDEETSKASITKQNPKQGGSFHSSVTAWGNARHNVSLRRRHSLHPGGNDVLK